MSGGGPPAFSPDGTQLALVLPGGAIRVYQGGAARDLAGHRGRVAALAFLPDGKLASAGGDGTLRLWDNGKGRGLWSNSGPLRRRAVSRDGKQLAAGDRDGRVRRFDVESGAARGEWRAQSGDINQLSFSPDGTLLASASDEEAVALFDAGGVRFLRGHQ